LQTISRRGFKLAGGAVAVVAGRFAASKGKKALGRRMSRAAPAIHSTYSSPAPTADVYNAASAFLDTRRRAPKQPSLASIT
jgi:hypothetical protein